MSLAYRGTGICRAILSSMIGGDFNHAVFSCNSRPVEAISPLLEVPGHLQKMSDAGATTPAKNIELGKCLL